MDSLNKKVEALPKDKKESVDSLRESLLSAILSHELAHYYNKHAFQKVKKIIGDGEDKKTLTASSELISASDKRWYTLGLLRWKKHLPIWRLDKT